MKNIKREGDHVPDSRPDNRIFDILKFRPDSLRYYIFSRFNKIAESFTEEAAAAETLLSEFKNTVAYSPFVTQESFVDNIKATGNLINEMNSIDTSPALKTALGDVLYKSVVQVEKIFDLFRVKNFGAVQTDYYEILNQIDSFMDSFMAEHEKNLNTINYDILNADLKTNYITQKLLDRRLFHLGRLVSAVRAEAGSPKGFVFDQNEMDIIREANFENSAMMAQAKNGLDQNTFSDAPVNLLNNIYGAQERIFRSTGLLASNNPVTQKSAIKIKSKSKAVLENENKEYFKYQYLDEVNFKLFYLRFKEFAETEQALFNFD